jgi:hypothetical protein
MLEKDQNTHSYTCHEYREEMILLALHRRLDQPGIDDEERERLCREIARLERIMGL